MPRSKNMIVRHLDDELPHIDPKKVPNCDYDIGCAILARIIKRALEDPVNRADYEAWRKTYVPRKAAE